MFLTPKGCGGCGLVGVDQKRKRKKRKKIGLKVSTVVLLMQRYSIKSNVLCSLLLHHSGTSFSLSVRLHDTQENRITGLVRL